MRQAELQMMEDEHNVNRNNMTKEVEKQKSELQQMKKELEKEKQEIVTNKFSAQSGIVDKLNSKETVNHTEESAPKSDAREASKTQINSSTLNAVAKDAKEQDPAKKAAIQHHQDSPTKESSGFLSGLLGKTDDNDPDFSDFENNFRFKVKETKKIKLPFSKVFDIILLTHDREYLFYPGSN